MELNATNAFSKCLGEVGQVQCEISREIIGTATLNIEDMKYVVYVNPLHSVDA